MSSENMSSESSPSGVGFSHSSIVLKDAGNRKFVEQNFHAAIASYSSAIAQATVEAPTVDSLRLVAECNSNLSQCYLQLGDFEQALAAASAVLALAKGGAAASSSSASASSGDSRSSAAAATSISSSGSGGGGSGGAGDLPAVAQALTPLLIEKCLLRRARALRGLKRPKEALQAYRALLKFSPAHATGQLERDELAGQQPQGEGGLERIAKAMRASPGAVYEDMALQRQQEEAEAAAAAGEEEEEPGSWEAGWCNTLLCGLCSCFRSCFRGSKGRKGE
jgi:tetratricopeptide (TPR) repeat protein